MNHATGPLPPGPSLCTQIASATHIGPVRSVNEDATTISPRLVAVADGMGGHGGGDVAAAIVTRHLFNSSAELWHTAEEITRVLEASAAEIRRLQSERSAPGTTIVAACATVQSGLPAWLIVSIGDSRAYVFSGGALRQVTHDHSQIQEMLDAGLLSPEQAAVSPYRNVITNALGAGITNVQPDFFLIPARPGDRLLLTSDGAHGVLAPEHLAELVAAGDTPQVVADSILLAALTGGTQDNATVAVLDVLSASPAWPDTDAPDPNTLSRVS